MKKITSEKKQKQKDDFSKIPLKVGDGVYVLDSSLCSYGKSDKEKLCKILSITGKSLKVNYENATYTIKKSDVISKNTMHVGENPFNTAFDNIRSVAFSLSSILHALGITSYDDREKYTINDVVIKRCNWNPFIYKNGKKYFYQRDFVWSIKDNQTLIESIYQNVDCGKILVRKRGWDELESMKGEKELAFNDIVDGKQRLHAVEEFINDGFKDFHGNYFSDLSDWAQIKFVEHQLFSYSEIPEGSKDDDIIRQFVKLNFTGVPQSEEHLKYVKSLL